MFTKKTLAAVSGLVALSAVAGAQTPPAPTHHGLFGSMFHHHAQTGQPGVTPTHHSLFPFHHAMAPGGQPGMATGNGGGAAAPIAGGVIGNKNTHVYHLPGDKSLPSPKNRVYFASAAAAQAAGYHAAGSAHGAGTTHHKTHH